MSKPFLAGKWRSYIYNNVEKTFKNIIINLKEQIMNKVTLSVAAIAALAPVYAQAAEGMTEQERQAALDAKKAAIASLRLELNTVTNYIQTNCADVKDEWLLNISYIEKDLEVLYNDDQKLEMPDVEGFSARIQGAKFGAIDAQKPWTSKHNIDAKYQVLKDLYDTSVADCDNYTTIGGGIKNAIKALGVEELGTTIEGFDLTKQDICAQEVTILNDINTKTQQINSLMDDIDNRNTAAASNQSSHDNIVAEYNAAVTEYKAQLQLAISSIPTPIYKNWQDEVIEKLNDQYRIIDAAFKADKESFDKGESTLYYAVNSAKIATAKGRVLTIVTNMVNKVNAEETAKTTADNAIDGLQTALSAIKTQLDNRGLTECNGDITTIQGLIDDLKNDIKTQYEANTLSTYNYSARQIDITSKTNAIDDNNEHGYALVISNYDCYTNTLSPAIEALQTSLDEKKTTASTKSADGQYDAATYYAPLYNTINTNIGTLRTNAKNAFRQYTAESFNTTNYPSAETLINTDIATYATETADALTAYNTAVAYTAAQQALLNQLKNIEGLDETVTEDGSFPANTGVETYGTMIANLQNQINAINKKVTDAKALTNTLHKNKLEDAANDAVYKNIQTLIDNYQTVKKQFDVNSAINAAYGVIAEANNRISALETSLAGVVGNPAGVWGDKTTEVTTGKAALEVRINAIKSTTSTAETDFESVLNNASSTDQQKHDAAANAIASLAVVKDKLEGKNGEANLENDVKVFVENQAAYLEIEALANAYVDDTATPLTAKKLNDLKNYINTNASSDPDTGNAQTHYLLEQAKLVNALAEIDTDVNTYFDNKQCVEKKQDVLDRIAKIESDALALQNAIVPNESAHNLQVINASSLQTVWNTIYENISQKDESTTAAEWLKQLARIQEQINALTKRIKKDFEAGKSVASNDEIDSLRKEYEQAINDIATAQATGYAAQIKKDNEDTHKGFESKWSNAYGKFSEAIETLNKFSVIKNSAITKALEELVDAHDDIYAYADMLRKLQADEAAVWAKYLVDDVDGVDDVYDATTYNNYADQYWQEIDGRLQQYQDAVNSVAVAAFSSSVTSARSNLTYYKSRVSSFQYPTVAVAFQTSENFVSAIEAAGAPNATGGTYDRMYAVNVDTWTNQLNNEFWSMLNTDFNAACDAERDYQIGIVETLYNYERTAIAGFKEIDNQSYINQLDVLKANTIDAARNGYDQSEDYITNTLMTLLGNYYGTIDPSHSDIYATAYNSSALNAANIAAYNDIQTWLGAVNNAAGSLETFVNGMYIGHTDVCYTGGIAVSARLASLLAEVELIAAQAESEKANGGCVAYKATITSRIETNGTIYADITSLKNAAVAEEIEALAKKIDLVKEEYNQNAKDDLDIVKEYDNKIKALYGTLLTNSEAGSNNTASIQYKWNNATLTSDEARTQLINHEVTIAKLSKELTDLYDKDAKAWNAAISTIQAEEEAIEFVLAQAEGWANYNQATKDLYLELVEGLRAEFELAKSNGETKTSDGTLLFYKDAILFDLASVKADIPQANTSALWNEYDKQKTNDDLFDSLSRTLEDRKSDLQARYDRIKDFTHRATIAYGQDYIEYQHTQLGNFINTLTSWLERDHNAVSLSDGCNTANQINNLQTSIYEMECNATKTEMDGIIYDLNQSITNSKANMTGKLYGGTRQTDLENEYTRINGLLGKAETFHTQLKTTFVSVDVDGNPILSYGYPITMNVSYLDEPTYGVKSLQARLAELKEAADQYAKDVIELAYLVGDADNDKRITVNDYSRVRNWILTAKKFEDVSESQRYAGDVNGDKLFTVADMTGISNLIFHGQWDWLPSASSARARSAAAAEDKLTLATESEETTIFGKTVRMAINLDNIEAFSAGQMDITLPQGMKLAGQSLSSRANGHEVLANEISNGTYRIVASTVENNEFNDRNGALIYLDVEVGSDYNGGNILIDNVIFSDTQAKSYYLTQNGPIVPTGINGIEAASVKERIYSVGGQMMKAVKKGINIIVGENNKTQKVVK